MERNIVYIHGFRSSGDSGKSRLLQDAFTGVKVLSPTLSAHPAEAIGQLERLLSELSGRTLLVGTSLGGFYALYLSCRYGYACCAINPAWRADTSLARKVGVHTRYDSEEVYDFRSEYLGELTGMRDFILQGHQDPGLINIFLSNDDEELSFDGLDTFIPKSRLLRRFDDSGHRFRRFPEILDDIRDILEDHLPARTLL
jgi:predicted esterase YcpF (UPF0227 family)